MKISIIVTAYNQHNEFLNVMSGIEVQTKKHPLLCAEVLVIDNGSDPPLETLQADGFRIPVRYIYRPFVRGNFRPASARNIGIRASRSELLLFIDGDCIPGPNYLESHFQRLSNASAPLVTLGHRVFIEGKLTNPSQIRERECDLSFLPEVPSSSNYNLKLDRRMEEFLGFERHPMPFHCCHGCNVGIRRADLETSGVFDEEFDGYWGYEDIEFGFRLWRSGAKITYVADAFVFHQESTDTVHRGRSLEARRNFELVCTKIPGFREYRTSLNRSYYIWNA